MSAHLSIDVWSDYVCPFCYLELPVLRRVQREGGRTLTVRWHAFELRPAPEPTLDPAGEYLRTTWETSVYPMAAERGMTLKLPPVQPYSRKAFEAAEFARDAARFDAMHDALFEAFFVRGEDIGSISVLTEIGRRAGLDALALRESLQDGVHTARVLDDQRQARWLRVHGVPLMVLRRTSETVNRGLPMSGAQPYEAVAEELERLGSTPPG